MWFQACLFYHLLGRGTTWTVWGRETLCCRERGLWSCEKEETANGSVPPEGVSATGAPRPSGCRADGGYCYSWFGRLYHVGVVNRNGRATTINSGNKSCYTGILWQLHMDFKFSVWLVDFPNQRLAHGILWTCLALHKLHYMKLLRSQATLESWMFCIISGLPHADS